jgi:hypothetical protein
MKMMVSCNQGRGRFEGVEAEAEPQPFTVRLRTPNGVHEVEIPDLTIMVGIMPALRNFILSNAERFGVVVKNTGDASGRKGGRLKLKEAAKPVPNKK